jgi:hypothetical protein
MRLRFSICVLVPALLTFLGSNGCVFNLDNLEKVEVPGVKETVPFMGEPGGLKTDYQMPGTVILCGETLPLELPAVRERLEAEFLLAVSHPAQVGLWQRRAKRYFPTIEAALKASGLPDDLKYLAVAESDLRPGVFSPAGAAGIWQFIPSTARRYGLKVNRQEDQRLLPENVLQAGIKYLGSLRQNFGNWALAMAAYNAGEARIAKAISAQGFRDYYQLRLPRETERYVYRIAAIKLVLVGANNLGLADTTPRNLYSPLNFRETSETFETPQTWVKLAEKYKCDYKTLRFLNPHLAHQETLSGGPYLFRTPGKV